MLIWGVCQCFVLFPAPVGIYAAEILAIFSQVQIVKFAVLQNCNLKGILFYLPISVPTPLFFLIYLALPAEKLTQHNAETTCFTLWRAGCLCVVQITAFFLEPYFQSQGEGIQGWKKTW